MIVYKNLEKELNKLNLSIAEIASLIDQPLEDVRSKFLGDSPFSMDEAFKIRDTFFPDLSVDYLFSRKKMNQDEYDSEFTVSTFNLHKLLFNTSFLASTDLMNVLQLQIAEDLDRIMQIVDEETFMISKRRQNSIIETLQEYDELCRRIPDISGRMEKHANYLELMFARKKKREQIEHDRKKNND